MTTPTNPVAIPGTPIVVSLADVTPTPVRWLWPGRIPLGRITLLSGRPGEGKSFLSIDIAARVTTGRGWPGGAGALRDEQNDDTDDASRTPGSVLFIAAEDGLADTLRPRLDACGADPSRVAAITGVVGAPRKGSNTEDVFTLSDAHALEAALDRLHDPRLIVIDPIGSYLGGDTDANADNKVRGLLAPIAAIAERRGVAVLIVAHTRKSHASGRGHADDAVMGSRAFTGLARSVLHLLRDPDDDARRLLLPGKNNLAAPSPGLAFTLEGDLEGGPRVVWQPGKIDRSASDVMNALAADTGTENAVTEAAEWLRDNLVHGPVQSGEVMRAATKDGITRGTLRRAKERLGVSSTRVGFGEDGQWVWAMPRHAADEPDAHADPPAHP